MANKIKILMTIMVILSDFIMIICSTGCDLGLLPGEGEPVTIIINKNEENKNAEEELQEKEITENSEDSEDKKTLESEEKKENQEEVSKEDVNVVEEIQISERLWSILVYMSADNNLEASAIEDFAEMELSVMNTDAVSVFVLLDRSAYYDTSNGNWSGTRLYKLKTGRNGTSRTLISEEIECKDLSLQVGVDTELDMSSEYVLSDALRYMQKRYPANYYGLIMWGHGTGWRGEEEVNGNEEIHSASVKGFAFDDSSKTYMTLKQFGEALKTGMNGEKLDFLGFDTCFGAEIEVMYELRDYVKFAVGSEGLLMSSGWNYKTIFNSLQADNEKTAKSLGTIIAKDFACHYENTSGASISVINMSEVSACFKAFDDCMGTVSDLITSRTIRDEVMGILYSNQNCKTQRFTYGAQNSDVYIDVKTAIIELKKYFNSTLLDTKVSEFEKAFSKCIEYNWNSDDFDGGLGVYFQTLSNGKLLSVSHPTAYIKGKTIDQIAFVNDSQSYVPGVKNEKSLLENLFYKSF